MHWVYAILMHFKDLKSSCKWFNLFKCLAYLLADAGYDVFLGNARGWCNFPMIISIS